MNCLGVEFRSLMLLLLDCLRGKHLVHLSAYSFSFVEITFEVNHHAHWSSFPREMEGIDTDPRGRNNCDHSAEDVMNTSKDAYKRSMVA